MESGAVGGTRTPTNVTSQRPQRCASTNSATTAGLKREKHLAKRCRHLKRKICKFGRMRAPAYPDSAAGLCTMVLRPARATAMKVTVATPITIHRRRAMSFVDPSEVYNFIINGEGTQWGASPQKDKIHE